MTQATLSQLPIVWRDVIWLVNTDREEATMARKQTAKIPAGIVPPAPRGPRMPRPGAGPHDSRPRGQRDRSGARRAALADQG